MACSLAIFPHQLTAARAQIKTTFSAAEVGEVNGHVGRPIVALSRAVIDRSNHATIKTQVFQEQLHLLTFLDGH
jgi:hypothetical protein